MAKERRSLFGMVFGPRQPTISSRDAMQIVQMITGQTSSFTTYRGHAYDKEIVRSAVDAFARNTAKIRGKHIRRDKVTNKIGKPARSLDKLLSVRPNKYMDAYSFHYKVATQYMMNNNAFIFPEWSDDGMTLKALYPIDAQTVEFVKPERGGPLYARFRFMSGQTLIVEYETLIHLRRFFFRHDLWGEPNDDALTPTLKLIHTVDEGIANAIKTSAVLRGLLKFTGIMKADDIKKSQKEFTEQYMSLTNSSGIAALDGKADYKELKTEPTLVDDKVMALIEKKVFRFFGTNEKIITSSYTEDEWNAYYESVIEPFALQLSLELTEKLFTPGERASGHEIVYESNRLQYASTKTKLELMQMVDRGAMTPNEWREVFNMAPVDGGDEVIRRLDTAPTGGAPPAAKPKPKEGDDDDDDGETAVSTEE